MWQRFREQARRAIYFAQEEAQKLGQTSVATEHLLLGLLKAEAGAVKVLISLGVSPDKIRSELLKHVVVAPSRPVQDMTLSPGAMKAIDHTYHEVKLLGHDYIETTHLLLGLVAYQEGIAARVLRQFNLNLLTLREVVRKFELAEPAKEQPSMWKYFNEEARIATYDAEGEAKQSGDDYLSTEHFALALLRSDCVAMRLIHRLGFPIPDLIEKIDRNMIKRSVPPKSHRTLAPRGKRVIDLAMHESLRMGQDFIGTEHLLLGIIAEADGLGGRVFASFGVRLEDVRNAVLAAKPKSPTPPPRAAEAGPTPVQMAAALLAVRQSTALPDTLALLLLAEKSEEICRGLNQLGITAETLVAALEVAMVSDSREDLPRGASLSALLSPSSSSTFLSIALHPSTYLSQAFSGMGITPEQIQTAFATDLNPPLT